MFSTEAELYVKVKTFIRLERLTLSLPLHRRLSTKVPPSSSPLSPKATMKKKTMRTRQKTMMAKSSRPIEMLKSFAR